MTRQYHQDQLNSTGDVKIKTQDPSEGKTRHDNVFAWSTSFLTPKL